MTVPVPSQLEFISDADGVTKDFSYPVRFLQKDEVVVALRDPDGIDDIQSLGTDYTIAGSSWPSGGTVSFLIAPQAPYKVVRYRMTQAKQTVDLADSGRNSAPSVELQLDRLAMAIQDRGARTDAAWWGLLAEIAARIQGDNLLNGRVDQEILDRISGDLQEKAERITADLALAGLIGQAGPVESRVFDTRLQASLANIKNTTQYILTLGSNAAGDGPLGIYKRDVGPTPGSFQSNDGAYWSNVSPEMDFLQFGADPSGIDVADQAIKNCFDRAAVVGARVVNHSGTYLWRHQQIDVLVDADLSGTTILLDTESGVKPSSWAAEAIFVIQPTGGKKRAFTASEITELNTPALKNLMATNGTYLPFSASVGKRDCMMTFYTDAVDIIRAGGLNETLLDFVVSGINGNLTVPFDRTLSVANITGGWIYEREAEKRTFRSPLFRSNQAGSFSAIRVYRHETDVHDFRFIEDVKPDTDMIRILVDVRECYRANFYGGHSECPDQPSAAYTITGFRAIWVQWHNYYAVDGWGATGLNHVKYWEWHDCVLNRVDVHWGARRFNACRRCTFKNGRSSVSGSGIWLWEDCEWQFGTDDGYVGTPTFAECIIPRQDYGSEFYGHFDVVRPIITIGREIADGSIISIVRAGTEVNYDPGRSVSLPSVSVKDAVIRASSNLGLTEGGLNIVAVNLDDARLVGAGATAGRVMFYPDSITVDGVSYHNWAGTALIRYSAVRANNYADNTVKCRKNIISTANGIPKPATNATIKVRDVYSLYPTRNVQAAGNFRATVDFRHSMGIWGSAYLADAVNCWYPDVSIADSTKVAIVVAIKGRIAISDSEVIYLSDNWGGSTGVPIIFQGGSLLPWRRDNTNAAPVFLTAAGTLKMLGVAVYSLANDDGLLGSYVLPSPQGAGNFVMTGAKTTNITGWDAAYVNFWAI